MRLKNEIFAEVLDWLVKNKGVDGQKGLSQLTGISKNTVSRIMTDKTEPSDDTLRRLNDAFGGIFNMKYLRGLSSVMFAEDAAYYKAHPEEHPFKDFEERLNNNESAQQSTHDGDLYRQMLDAANKHVADLRKSNECLESMVHNRDATIQELRERIEAYIAEVASLNAHLEHYKREVTAEHNHVEEVKNQLNDVRIANVSLQNDVEYKKIEIANLKAEIEARRLNPAYDYPLPLGVAESEDKK